MFALGNLFNTYLAPRLGKIIAVVILLAILFYLAYLPYKNLKTELKAQQDSTSLYRQQAKQLALVNKDLVRERDEWHSEYYKQVLLRQEKITTAKKKAVEQPLKKQLVTFSTLTGQPIPIELTPQTTVFQASPIFLPFGQRGPLLAMDSTTFAYTLGLLAEQKQTMVEDSVLLKTCALIKLDAKNFVQDIEAEVKKARFINIPSLKRKLTRVLNDHEALKENLLK